MNAIDVVWPEQIINAAKYHNLVLVIGAGISAKSIAENQNGEEFKDCTSGEPISPPQWRKLLEELSNMLPFPSQDAIKPLIESKNYTDAAEAIKYYHKENNISLPRYKSTLEKLLKNPANGYEFKPNDWHDAIADLSPQIIITTNYDNLLEQKFKEGFEHLTPDRSDMQTFIQHSSPSIIYFHGNLSNPSTIVLSQSDYANNESKYSHMFEMLESLLRTKIFLFLGYSLNDPDMLILLQKTKMGNSKDSRFMLTDKSTVDYRRNMLERVYGVSMIPYDNTDGSHSSGISALKELGKSINENVGFFSP